MLQGKWLRTITMATALCGILLSQGCKKENGIDNNSVISTPYALYYGDNVGGVFNTNDGILFKKIFNPDATISTVRSFAISGDNLFFVKGVGVAYWSTDNGDNFNPKYYFVNPAATHQSMMLDVPAHNRLYVASTNAYGIAYSEDHGASWHNDIMVDTAVIKSGFYPTSFAQLKSGDLFAFSNVTQKIYKRTAASADWLEIIPTGLPVGSYFICRLNDALVASDRLGGGVYFSVNRGLNWTAYNGIAGQSVNAAYAPFDQTLLVGTSRGVYRLVSGSFVPSNNGLAAGANVFSITAKMDTYKNGVIKQYIYLGTNKGLFRSEDGGQNWVYLPDQFSLDNLPHDTRIVF